MEQTLKMSMQEFEPPFKNQQVQVDSRCEDDSDDAIKKEVKDIKRRDKAWNDFENLVNKGPPNGFKLEEGIIWLHKPKAILCIANLQAETSSEQENCLVLFRRDERNQIYYKP